MSENNQNNLQTALDNLPQYDAPNGVWDAIAARLPLIELPNYEAPESVWNAISERLPLAELPNYDAPDAIWQNLEKALATDTENQSLDSEPLPSLRVVSLQVKRFDRRFWAVAASIALFVSVGLWYFNAKKGTETGLQVSTEVVDNQLLKHEVDKSMNSDEASFLMVEEFCKTAAVACEKPAFKKLKQELDELNLAREELKTALTDYNTNADMVAELTKIENERTGVLQQLVDITTTLNE